MTEEVAKKRTSFGFEHALLHYELVVEGGVIEHVQDGAGCTCLGVACGEDKPGQPGVQHGAGAHGAGLQRANEGAAE